jgi:cysteinyl-tRNA synthetase
MEWDSPWGVGFPGWHIECSAMAIRYLGERLDIHCGGIDHIPVHHTNEIAQAESALGHQWVNWWLHGEFLTFPKGDDEEARMSKSSGEFLTLDVLVNRGFDPLAYRYFLLNAHYRQQLAFTWDALAAAANALKRLRRTVVDLRAEYKGDEPPIQSRLDELHAAARDDLNMPQALAAMWATTKDSARTKGEIYATLLAMDPILGFGFETMEEDQIEISEDEKAEIQRLVDERAAARKDKNFARADEIREQLKQMGVAVEDTPDGTVWRKA